MVCFQYSTVIIKLRLSFKSEIINLKIFQHFDAYFVNLFSQGKPNMKIVFLIISFNPFEICKQVGNSRWRSDMEIALNGVRSVWEPDLATTICPAYSIFNSDNFAAVTIHVSHEELIPFSGKALLIWERIFSKCLLQISLGDYRE